MATAASLNPKAVLLADTSAKGDGPLLAGAVIRGKSSAPIVSYTVSAAGGGGPGPDPRNTAPQIQQRFLAETWIQATTATDDTAQGRVRVITTAAQARGDDSTVDAPWLKQSTLTELLDTVPKAWNQKFRYPAAARSAELTIGQLNSLNRAVPELSDLRRPAGRRRGGRGRPETQPWPARRARTGAGTTNPGGRC